MSWPVLFKVPRSLYTVSAEMRLKLSINVRQPSFAKAGVVGCAVSSFVIIRDSDIDLMKSTVSPLSS